MWRGDPLTKCSDEVRRWAEVNSHQSSLVKVKFTLDWCDCMNHYTHCQGPGVPALTIVTSLSICTQAHSNTVQHLQPHQQYIDIHYRLGQEFQSCPDPQVKNKYNQSSIFFFFLTYVGLNEDNVRNKSRCDLVVDVRLNCLFSVFLTNNGLAGWHIIFCLKSVFSSKTIWLLTWWAILDNFSADQQFVWLIE